MRQPSRRGGIGGAEGIRTPDLRRAKAALSRLSYGPAGGSLAVWGGVRVRVVDPDVVREAVSEPAEGSPDHRRAFQSGLSKPPDAQPPPRYRVASPKTAAALRPRNAGREEAMCRIRRIVVS